MSHKKEAGLIWVESIEKILSGIPSECQTVWIQISLCPNCYQRLSADNTSRQRVNSPIKGIVRAYMYVKFMIMHSCRQDLLSIYLFMDLPVIVFEASPKTLG